MSIEEMKERFLAGKLPGGMYASENDKREGVIVIIRENGFETKTLQENDWLRTNIYTYDKEDNTWTEEELYER